MRRCRRSIVRFAPLVGIGAIALITATLAGCDLMAVPTSPRPSRVVATQVPPPPLLPAATDETPTLRPEPSGYGPDLLDAANALADLDSYRVTVRSRGLVPAATAGGIVTMTSTLIQVAAPAAEFTMTGVDGLDGGRLEAIVIGDEAWLRSGGGPWRKTPGGAADFDAAFTTLSPIGLVAGFESLTTAIALVGDERKNGLRAVHYRSESGDPDAAAAGLTGGAVDLWLAADGGHLVSLAIDGTWDLDGIPTPTLLLIEVTHVNDPANRIVAPG